MNILVVITYLIYILFWESLIIGGGAYIVFWLDFSGWWILLVLYLSSTAYKPSQWHCLLTGKKYSEEKEGLT